MRKCLSCHIYHESEADSEIKKSCSYQAEIYAVKAVRLYAGAV